ncbi:MAG: quinolinate synthase NadA [Chitinophagales bacterium]|nr:quinolinate synthase NadA [Chitinophagales bacterium]
MLIETHPPAIQELYSAIRKLKQEKDAVVLAHYYMSPELQLTEKDGGIADFIGDSLGLSVEATKVKAKHIIFCGVKFMAETAKVLNPDKQVLIPDKEAGCSLASSITAEDVLELKRKHPGVPVIAYVNTYAETKAECDICCTSRNALAIARSFDSDTLIFIPDVYMGQNLQQKIEAETGKKLILWHGTCEVHEQFTGLSMEMMKKANPDAEVLLHWEVPKETVATSFCEAKGVLGSTNDILRYVGESHAKKFILASECDLGATLKGMYPDKEFITPCFKCPYMKKITLQNTLATLQAIGTPDAAKYDISIPEEIMHKAYIPIKRMLDFA